MSSPDVGSDPLDQIFADYRVLYRHAVENNHARSRFAVLRLSVYKKLARAFSRDEMEEHVDLIGEYLDRVEQEVRADIERGRVRDQIDWQEVLEHAVEVADELSWKADFHYNPSADQISIEPRGDHHHLVTHRFADFKARLKERIGPALMQIIQVTVRSPDPSDDRSARSAPSPR